MKAKDTKGVARIHKSKNDLDFLILLVFNATFSNISAISWRPILVVVKSVKAILTLRI
jgi:hypothetical protein